MEKCKHGLGLGTCWTCKTGERIKGEGPGSQSAIGDMARGIGWIYGMSYRNDDWWDWDGVRVRTQGERKEAVIPKTPCDVG